MRLNSNKSIFDTGTKTTHYCDPLTKTNQKCSKFKTDALSVIGRMISPRKFSYHLIKSSSWPQKVGQNDFKISNYAKGKLTSRSVVSVGVGANKFRVNAFWIDNCFSNSAQFFPNFQLNSFLFKAKRICWCGRGWRYRVIRIFRRRTLVHIGRGIFEKCTKSKKELKPCLCELTSGGLL